MIRTYPDSGVLISAARGKGAIAQQALAILTDVTHRQFASSDYVKLEVLPKPTWTGRMAEVRIYDEFFASVSFWLEPGPELLGLAMEEACRWGLSAMDALQIVSAHLCGCDEFVTSERIASPIHRTKLVRVVSIDSFE